VPARALALGLGVLVLLGTLAVTALLVVYPREVRAGRGRTFVVAIPENADARAVADLLHDREVIDDPWIFAVYLRITNADDVLRRGDVLLGDRLRPDEVARRLRSDRDGVPVRVTVPEGYTRFDVARRLDATGVCDEAAFLEASALPPDGIEAPSAEGYLFPDTYELRTQSDPRAVVRRMVRNHFERTEELYERHGLALERLQEDLGMGPHEVVVLASVVEKEAAVADERAIIAGVFLNRLRSETFRPRRRLQADPTVSYGCLAEPTAAPSCARFDGRITRAMLDDAANRYNSYRHEGLPPGPIANPGLASIVAVLDPTVHDYLYFVARGGRRHRFSATLERHNEGVDELRERERRR
jgi:UPF0755 protein